MVSYLTDLYGGDLGLHVAGHFLRVLRLPDCLVHASRLQAQVLDREVAFEKKFHGLRNMDIHVLARELHYGVAKSQQRVKGFWSDYKHGEGGA